MNYINEFPKQTLTYKYSENDQALIPRSILLKIYGCILSLLIYAYRTQFSGF
jgi:hypothetical protein